MTKSEAVEQVKEPQQQQQRQDEQFDLTLNPSYLIRAAAHLACNQPSLAGKRVPLQSLQNLASQPLTIRYQFLHYDIQMRTNASLQLACSKLQASPLLSINARHSKTFSVKASYNPLSASL